MSYIMKPVESLLRGTKIRKRNYIVSLWLEKGQLHKFTLAVGRVYKGKISFPRCGVEKELHWKFTLGSQCALVESEMHEKSGFICPEHIFVTEHLFVDDLTLFCWLTVNILCLLTSSNWKLQGFFLLDYPVAFGLLSREEKSCFFLLVRKYIFNWATLEKGDGCR